MLGAIAGDIIGSVYEHYDIKTSDFELFDRNSRFTDDTVLTVATAYAILEEEDYGRAYKSFARRYPSAGYGYRFFQWSMSPEQKPYNSFGNGSAMRVSPVGFAFNSVEEVLAEATKSAEVTHNHPEGIKGAQAVALSIFLARIGKDKQVIKQHLIERFSYNLDRKLAEIRPEYKFDVSCQGSVPEAITAFLESEGFEDAVRKAVSLGGDSDTIACIAGSIAQGYYKAITDEITSQVRKRLPTDFLRIIDDFNSKYNV